MPRFSHTIADVCQCRGVAGSHSRFQTMFFGRYLPFSHKQYSLTVVIQSCILGGCINTTRMPSDNSSVLPYHNY